MLSVEMLGGFPLLAGLDPTFLEKLSSIAEEIPVARGEWLFHEGDTAVALYLISRGTVELRFHLDRNRDIYVDLKTLDAGDALGWSALVAPYVYSMGAMASEDSQLVKLDGEKLRTLVEAHPEQGYALMQGIAQAMATRLTSLSEQAPGLSLRLIVSLVLFTLSVVAILILVLLAVVSVGSAAGGHPQSLDAVPMALLCLIVPVALLLLARNLYPGTSRSQKKSA